MTKAFLESCDTEYLGPRKLLWKSTRHCSLPGRQTCMIMMMPLPNILLKSTSVSLCLTLSAYRMVDTVFNTQRCWVFGPGLSIQQPFKMCVNKIKMVCLSYVSKRKTWDLFLWWHYLPPVKGTCHSKFCVPTWLGHGLPDIRLNIMWCMSEDVTDINLGTGVNKSDAPPWVDGQSSSNSWWAWTVQKAKTG